MVAIDLIVQHVHSQLEEVSSPNTNCTLEGGATLCSKAITKEKLLTGFTII